MADPRQIKDNLVVSLDYTLRLGNGEILDTSNGQEPLDFVQGQGQIIPGLEQELYGMAIGEEKDVVVEPENGYGLKDPNAFQLVPRNAFPPDAPLKPGLSLQMQNRSGHVFPATVAQIQPDGVLLDFNHPLAGETLHFHVQVVGLREATPEELAHGHVHHDGHH